MKAKLGHQKDLCHGLAKWHKASSLSSLKGNLFSCKMVIKLLTRNVVMIEYNDYKEFTNNWIYLAWCQDHIKFSHTPHTTKNALICSQEANDILKKKFASEQVEKVLPRLPLMHAQLVHYQKLYCMNKRPFKMDSLSSPSTYSLFFPSLSTTSGLLKYLQGICLQ